MAGNIGLLHSSPAGDGDGGGGVPSDGSTTAGSILTTSKEHHNYYLATEVSSSYPNDIGDDLELGLGLSIGLNEKSKSKSKSGAPCWGQYARILTAKDFPCLISKPSSSSSSSSSSSVNIPNLSTSGSKRSATASVFPPNGTSVIGWPPIRRAHKMPNIANQTKSKNAEFSSKFEDKSEKSNHYSQDKKGIANNGYLSVKVNMDGTPIGRKVDLNAHNSYETLAQTLEHMFSGTSSGPLKLLDGTSEFVLTYEDKDGDCMLVGDVPWLMFLGSVKRIRIMRNSESNRLAPKIQEKNARRRTDGT